MNRLAACFGMLCALIAGCGRRDTSPPGFVDACYGGRENMARNWVLSDNRMVLTVEGEEADWPLLARIVREGGEKLGYQVFDTSANIPDYIRTVEVSVCDRSGIFLGMDKRVYLREAAVRSGPPPDNRIVTWLRTYDRAADWRPLAESVQASFREHWKGRVEIEFPPLRDTPLSKMALPDEIRAELQAECRAATAGRRAYYCEGEPTR
jgi:hypothetical protein